MKLPTAVTTTVLLAGFASASCRDSSAPSEISGSSWLRRRSTGTPPIRSIAAAVPPPTRTSSSTLICGMAKRSLQAFTISAETIASVSGILIVKQEPWPCVLARSMVPPMRSILLRTTSMPTPRPEIAVTASAVEKPARNMKLRTCASVIAASSVSVASPLLSTLARIATTSSPRPSSATSIMMWPPS